MDEKLSNSSFTGESTGAETPAASDLALSNRPLPANSTTLCVVGVGASAGGLEALESFFATCRPIPAWAFVVVQHLSPDFKSLMDELLARHTEDCRSIASKTICSSSPTPSISSHRRRR